MKIVLDTNVLLVSISDRSAYHWIFRSFLEERFELVLTTDIFSEYHEIVSNHMGTSVAENILNAIENANNTKLVTKYFQWDLIRTDRDDNKFVDCAIAGSADHLVTEDKHFDVLSSVTIPKVSVIDISTFQTLLNR